jgi:poly(A) polymerase
MDQVFQRLEAAGIEAYEASFTALDKYRGLEPGPIRFILAIAGLQDLAKALDGLRFPGLGFADAALDLESDGSLGSDRRDPSTCYIRCADSPAQAEPAAFAQLDLLRDNRRDVFLDPREVYTCLRTAEALRSGVGRADRGDEATFEAAVLLARQPYEIREEDEPSEPPRDYPIEAQRALLSLVLTGSSPWRGLELLRRSGFVEAYWPELADLAGTDQSKEFHPEGDAWDHTLETLRHRKLPSLGLSLALLLHDAGKPRAEKSEGRQFDRHAEIGRSVAERFLSRLGFPPALVADVSFLVRYHMMPAALGRLPANRLQGIIDDPRFPVLLEVYKCDELSTFRGPDGYYEACAAYKAWLRNSRNPWRGADGKKLARMYLEPQAAKAATTINFPKGLAKR